MIKPKYKIFEHELEGMIWYTISRLEIFLWWKYYAVVTEWEYYQGSFPRKFESELEATNFILLLDKDYWNEKKTLIKEI